ncbi:PilZ domain-containing protein [Amaricoccus sp.]|uniref:PilZ domain-containing protein n=1 Tax=Amaricoccus sp. TaxID=1872485 RepID=UPI001B3F3053|nr:PilZ domain-containing protein [Amaricoccus sp.]MBP7000577.1 PilZ domain-containing protein [Amaricoccus sp.]
MGEERRQAERRRMLRRGRIVFRKGHGVIDCVVLDISSGGARLRAPAALMIPDRFQLRIDDGSSYEVAVCHRGEGIAGVRFLDRAA